MKKLECKSKTSFSLLLIFMILFASCTNFFSNSWGSWAARDPDKIVPTVTADNVDELIALSENNPDLSLSVLKKILDAIKGASGKDAEKLRNAALKAALNASGMAMGVLQSAGELVSLDNDEQARDLVLDSLDNMKNLEDSCETLVQILPEPGTPEFDAFLESADTNDLALAAAMLIAGEAKKNSDSKEYIESGFDKSNPQGPEETMAVSMMDAINKKEDELNDSLKELLKGLKLL